MKHLNFLLLLLIALPFSSSAQCLSGNYTIGKNAANYPDLTSAVSDLVTNGVCGPVTFLVSDDTTYSEQIEIPFITGSSASNSITFRSAAGNAGKPFMGFSGTIAKPYLVLLDSASFITFDSFQLNFITAPLVFPNATATILMDHGASHNTFRNCTLYSDSLIWDQVYFPSSSSCNDNEISGSEILYGDIYLNGDLTQFPSENIRIINNIFDESRTITLSGIGKFLVKGNTFENVSPVRFDFAISTNSCNHGGSIEGNKLSGGWINGIQLFADSSLTDTILIANNMISAGNVSGGSAQIKGIEIFSSYNVNVYNNNVGVYSTGLPLYDASIYISPANNINLKNNNFCNFSNGLAMYYTGSTAALSSDYNNYYSSASPLIGSSSSQTFTDLAAWQASFGGPDSNSVSIDPLYADTNDLHVSQIALRNKAISLPQIKFDFDLEPRNAAPDIGADEFAAVTDSVWPGDSNNDGISSADDIIPIGLYFGETGPSRLTVSSAWGAYSSSPWNIQLPDFNDAKFADCNGDGIINLSDTVAITNNLGNTHPLRLANVAAPAHQRVHFIFQNDTVISGNSLGMVIALQSLNVNPVDSVYSFAYKADIDTAFVNDLSFLFNPQTQVWGVFKATYIALQNYNSNSKVLNLAITGIDHHNKKPSTLINNVQFKFNNTSSSGIWYHFPFRDIQVYNKDGRMIPVTVDVDSVFIANIVGIHEIQQKAFSFFTQSDKTISFRSEISRVKIYNSIGQVIVDKSGVRNGDEISISGKSSSVNIVEIFINDKAYRYKIYVN